MPKLSVPEANQIMLQNFEHLRKIAKCLVFYFNHMHEEKKGWKLHNCSLKGRHRVNFEAVLDALDVVSSSQSGMDNWLDWVNDRIKDYKNLTRKSESLIVEEENVLKN